MVANARWLSCAFGLVLALVSDVAPARGQDLHALTFDFQKELFWPREVELWRWMSIVPVEAPPVRAARISLFRMPTGFIGDPIGMNSEFDDPASAVENSPGQGRADDLDRSVQFALGMHNPFFDFRRAGDPGGIGYYWVHAQYQLLDTGPTAISLGMQAMTPAGRESDGVADGPTMICPNIAWFQDLGDGVALQGFAGKNFRANADTVGHMRSGLHYGMALQYAIPGLCDSCNRGLYFFVEGLGRYRYESSPGLGPVAGWELVPGLHWRLRDDFWLSFGAARTGLFTCSWRF